MSQADNQTKAHLPKAGPVTEARYELSPMQEVMLVHTLASPGVGMYISQGGNRFDQIDVAAMEQAWQMVTDRHEVLRTSFEWEGLDRPQQIVHPKVMVTFERHDLQELSDWEQKIRLREIMALDRNRGFDLNRPPMFRLLLFQRSEHSYYLAFTHHHLLLDGWSVPILMEEVHTFYHAILNGHTVALPQPRPFRKYIQWLREQSMENEKIFWREYLNGVTGATPLPLDLGAHRQAGHRLNSEEWKLAIKDPLLSNLQTTARKCHVTLNTLIQAAWAIALSRYSGLEHVVFGTLVSGRSLALKGIESMIGMFINALPIHVKVDTHAPLKEWLKYLQARQHALQEHEFSPLNRVQRWSDIPGGTNLFESIIDINNTHIPREETTEGAINAPVNQNVPLLLFVKPGTSQLLFIIFYNTRRFTKPAVVQIGELIQTLLAAMCEDIEQPVGEISMISDQEAQRITVSWNKTEMFYPKESTMHALFEAKAASRPAAPAVHYLDRTLSYEALNLKSNQLAHHLITMGIARGKLVGFCLDRSLEMTIVLLAILKTGAGYVPLDPNYPFERLKMMLTDSKAELLITQEKWLAELDGIAPRQVCIDTESEAWSHQKTTNPAIDLSPEDIAWILYTSGSTGVPKGIVIPHRVAVNRMSTEHDPFEPDEVLCAKTSICFVDSIWELWSAWINGLPVTLIPQAHTKDPGKMIDTLAATGATRIVLVPSLLRAMLDAAPELGARLPRLKHWICSGEALPADLSTRFRQALPNAVLVNEYGTTEIWDAARCDTRDDLPYDSMPIGKPMGNMQCYVLDDMMRPVPIGIAGELHISGTHMAHGYWQRPDLTARQFVPNPFSREPGQRLYKTGDLVRWLPEGHIEYIGRRDQQIKLRGFRIELGEIESVIRQLPDISHAAVTVSENDHLVAYIVTEKDPPPTSSALRKQVLGRLPEYMTPVFYLPIEQIPLTPIGKTDRRNLPVPQPEALRQIAELEAVSRPPETPTETTVAAVWANMLGLNSVGAETDFLQLGGDSLLAARIIMKLGKMLNIRIPLSALMETRTVSGLAGWIDHAVASGVGDTLAEPPELAITDHGKKAPLSYAQQQMWFLDQLDPGSVSYTQSNIMRFPLAVDIKSLNAALSALVARHEILRTTYAAIDGDPYQIINDPQDVAVTVADVMHLPFELRDDAAYQKIREQAQLPWELANDPPFRYQLLKLGDNDFILAMTLHHIATDGFSMGILTHEIQTLYSAFHENRPTQLPELPIQYADYAIWQRDWLRGGQLDSQLGYWKQKLDDAANLELPTDHPRPRVHRYRGGHFSFRLDKDVVHPMRALALEENATMFMALLATFQLLLARYTGQDDICVGTPTANRSQPQLEQLIGYFVNTLVIRTRITGDPSFRDFLAMVRSDCVGAYDHQEVPFEKVVDALGVQRDLGKNPLFQVLFIHHILATDEAGAPARQRGPERETSNFDLVLSAQETTDSMECTLLYNSDLFESSTIERMATHLKLLGKECVSHPDRALSQTSMLQTHERRQILKSFSQPETRPLETHCAHEVIAAHAREHPEKIAIRMGGDTLTYNELDARANQMARHLQHLGVGPETVVGWCVERTPHIFVGLLGIMKAGGAFLSLDPAHPRERLAYMLKDTAAPLVVTQKKLVSQLPETRCQTVVDEDGETIARYDTTPPDSGVTPGNLAYVMYTSGSTGLPKGVMVTHGNLANLIAVQIPKFNINKDSRVLQTLSLSFDAALGEIFRTLMAGATLHLAPREELMPGPGLIELLKNQHITSVTLSAAALAALPRASQALPELKNLTVGGDTCAPELVAHWRKNRRFMNGYGPTETTIGATLAANWDPNSKPPLGPPLPNVEAYVLDRWMQPVPIGTPGELYIGGIGVTRGYLNSPDQTAASFLPNPFGNQAGGRLYRTGDLVRWLPDGKLDFLGRMDHQVKIRGYRIELSEIEAVLSRHAQVNQAVVVVHAEKGLKRLAAYVTPESDLKPEPRDLRDHLKTNLPDYMVPAFLMVCESLPMTVNGKIDRKALPKPATDQLDLEQQYVAPETDIEKTIAGIWADMLGLEKVGIHSNFFELGGDSILSIRVVARITEAGYELTPKEMFQYQTVAELAGILNKDSAVLN